MRAPIWGRCLRASLSVPARNEAGFSVDEAIDILIAPICYRILFSNGETSPEYVNALLARFGRLNDAMSSNSPCATPSEQ